MGVGFGNSHRVAYLSVDAASPEAPSAASSWQPRGPICKTVSGLDRVVNRLCIGRVRKCPASSASILSLQVTYFGTTSAPLLDGRDDGRHNQLSLNRGTDLRPSHPLRHGKNKRHQLNGNCNGCSSSQHGALHVGMTKIPRILSPGLQENLPGIGPLKYFLPGYFCGTRTGSKSKTYSSDFVNHTMVSYRPENRLEQCNPCSKCQMIRLRIRSPRLVKIG